MSSKGLLTKRQREVLERLDRGQTVRVIANDIGISRAAVYQTIERLRQAGALSADFTASGASSSGRKRAAARRGWVAPADSRLEAVRALGASEGDGEPYAEALAAAIAERDVLALAYLLGRTDAGEGCDLERTLAESALRQLGALHRAAEPVPDRSGFEGVSPA